VFSVCLKEQDKYEDIMERFCPICSRFPSCTVHSPVGLIASVLLPFLSPARSAKTTLRSNELKGLEEVVMLLYFKLWLHLSSFIFTQCVIHISDLIQSFDTIPAPPHTHTHTRTLRLCFHRGLYLQDCLLFFTIFPDVFGMLSVAARSLHVFSARGAHSAKR